MMQGNGDPPADGSPLFPREDDMSEGDLGDGGMGGRPTQHRDRTQRSRIWSKGDFVELPHQMVFHKRPSEASVPFTWTSCGGMYAVFRQELDGQRLSTRLVGRKSESFLDDSSEALQKRLQEVTEEVELLRSELEVTHRHLQGKHEALRILQGQAILDKATSHTKILLQRSEERTKALEKEVNALQWEITFNQVQFKNVEQSWRINYERICAENKTLTKTLEERTRELQELREENSSLSRQCLELLAMLSVRDRTDFQRTQPPNTTRGERSALELAVFGACECFPKVGEPCPCAQRAAASRKQVLKLTQELDTQRKRAEEAFVMADAFRIAFEQQLRRGSENVLRLAETDRHRPHSQSLEHGKQGSVAQRLKGLLPSAREGKIPEDTLLRLLDLLSDKEEALAHQRKVSYMLARSAEELEKRLQTQLNGGDCVHKNTGREGNADASPNGVTDKRTDKDTRANTRTVASNHVSLDPETDRVSPGPPESVRVSLSNDQGNVLEDLNIQKCQNCVSSQPPNEKREVISEHEQEG
ncbi:coiled-coil domain-containing protein 125 [Chanos chanos]|uniref:Coiled-coil domain-containing protein 125 n=1 Tax=Chanos chanos TaxID=29144 RepID=A0A6J2WTT7_CHACN|nr:coiled-coil domain-containing protein 125 [Chanos chanos]